MSMKKLVSSLADKFAVRRVVNQMRAHKVVQTSASFHQKHEHPRIKLLSGDAATRVSQLPNGLRVASEDLKMPTCTVGLWIDAGTRYENAENNGVAHFLEHMAFKGTKKRTQHKLELEIENMGAHLNAYTSREQTVYYCKCFSEHLPRAVEILADILLSSKTFQNSVWYERAAIERERHTILREVQEIEYNLQEVTFDFLHSTAFEGCTLAYTILGPVHNIEKITRDELVKFVTDHYHGSRMVVAAAGGIDHDLLAELSIEHFGHLDGCAHDTFRPDAHIRSRAIFNSSQFVHNDTNMGQVYGALAFEGPGWIEGDNIALMIANALVGIWERTLTTDTENSLSRLAARCSAGDLCHSFQQFSTCYIDSGLWGIYFVCEPDKVGQFLAAAQNEWLRLCSEELSDEQVNRAKNLLKANLLLSLDGSTPVCEDIGRQILCYGRRVPLPELEYRIDSVTARTVNEVVRKYALNKPLALAALGPAHALPHLDTLHANMKNNFNPDL